MSGNSLRTSGATKDTNNHVSRTHRKKVLLRTRTRPEKMNVQQLYLCTNLIPLMCCCFLIVKSVALRTCLPIQFLFRLVCVCIQRSYYRDLPIRANSFSVDNDLINYKRYHLTCDCVTNWTSFHPFTTDSAK